MKNPSPEITEEILHNCAIIAFSGVAEADPSEINTEGFELVNDGNWPEYYKCEVTVRHFVGDFCIFKEGLGCWVFEEDGETVRAVQDQRAIFNYLEMVAAPDHLSEPAPITTAEVLTKYNEHLATLTR